MIFKYRSGKSHCGLVERRGFLEGQVIKEIVMAGGAANSFAQRATEVLVRKQE